MANYYGFTGDDTQKSDVDVFVPELWSAINLAFA